jgi:hypothetical protein
MIYVPNYIYVPPLAVEILTGARHITPADEFLLWTRMKQNRDRAANIISRLAFLWPPDEQPVPSLNTVWLKLAHLTPNTEAWRQDHKHLQKIDDLQHTKAHKHWRHFSETKTNAAKTEDCYDLFIRPMDQLFAND